MILNASKIDMHEVATSFRIATSQGQMIKVYVSNKLAI